MRKFTKSYATKRKSAYTRRRKIAPLSKGKSKKRSGESDIFGTLKLFNAKHKDRYRKSRQRPARPKVTAGTKRAPKVMASYRTNAKDWAESGAWVRVVSSNVKGISYAYNSGILFVEFNGWGKSIDSVYAYYGVPPQVAKSMFNAPSMGKFVWKHLRGKYDYRRIK